MSKALRIPGAGRPRRSGLALVVLTVASVAVLTTAGVWLRAGWTSVGLELRSQLCNGTPLDGFTLSGALGWTGSENRLHFTLENGVLHTRLQLDDPDAVHNSTGVTVNRDYALAPETRAQADADAVVNRASIEGNRQANATVDRVCRMYTLHLPDGTELRLCVGEEDLLGTATLTATEWNPRDDVSYSDYRLAVLPDADTDWPDAPVSTQSFVLGAGQGLCWTRDLAGRSPGLYRAQGLTWDQIEELPADGTVQGDPVVCNSTEYGTLTPFYCPADARQALLGASMADGSTLLLYLKGEDLLCADLVNAAGSRTDHRELGTLEETEGIEARLLPRTADRDAAVWVETYNQESDGMRYSSALPKIVLLRTENGRFTVACTMEDKDHLNPDTALLNETGDQVLFAYDNTIYQKGMPTLAGENGLGTDLRVYDLAGGRLQYWGTMSTGAERDWYADSLGNGKVIQREIHYDSLQKDGGNWK